MCLKAISSLNYSLYLATLMLIVEYFDMSVMCAIAWLWYRYITFFDSLGASIKPAALTFASGTCAINEPSSFK
jgi:hypothetical protein